MNYCCETAKMGVPPDNRPAVPRDWCRGVPEGYVAGIDTRGRQEGRPYLWSQQVIHEIYGLNVRKRFHFIVVRLLPPQSRPGATGNAHAVAFSKICFDSRCVAC